MNDPPEALDMTITLLEDSSSTFNLDGIDVDEDDDIWEENDVGEDEEMASIAQIPPPRPSELDINSEEE